MIETSGKSYKFLNRFNKIVTINLSNLVILLKSGSIKSLDDMPQKYKDFVGFIAFKSKKRAWFWKYSLKALYFVFNYFIMSHYGLFASQPGIWRKSSTSYKGKDSIQQGNFFSKFNQWKSFHSTNSVSSSNENASKFSKKSLKN